jgi:hypothetical protein
MGTCCFLEGGVGSNRSLALLVAIGVEKADEFSLEIRAVTRALRRPCGEALRIVEVGAGQGRMDGRREADETKTQQASGWAAEHQGKTP